MRDRKVLDPDGGMWGGAGISIGRGAHNQGVLYEKNIYFQ